MIVCLEARLLKGFPIASGWTTGGIAPPQRRISFFNCRTFVFIYSVVCKDEEGKVLVMKSTGAWNVSRCLRCLCIEGLVTCKRTLIVYFPAFFGAVYEHEETCKQPSCKILEFVRNNKKWCEGENSYIGNWKAHFVRPELKTKLDTEPRINHKPGTF